MYEVTMQRKTHTPRLLGYQGEVGSVRGDISHIKYYKKD